MISVSEAKKIIGENIVALPAVSLALHEATGKVLSEDVYAPFDIPTFPQSSMDGYAFSFSDWNAKKTLPVDGEIAAGTNEAFTLSSGKAVRIFTGAPVPPGADTVVMQEKVKLNALRELTVEDATLKQGSNVRLRGSEIKAGELALEAGSYLSPAATGFLAGIGIAEVKIIPRPSVAIIVTGNELQQTGQPLQYGQVYESNSIALRAALQQAGITDIKMLSTPDNLEILTSNLDLALQQSDMVLITGGISAGDYDFVLQAATQCGAWKMFHKVTQRPGKPLFFGMKGKKGVFGLPGNPSSVLTCFYEYVTPALALLSNTESKIIKKYVPLGKTFCKAAGLTHFLKGFYDGRTALPLHAQESYRLRSFAKANCLIQINEDVTEHKEGDIVEIHLLPLSNTNA